jgi:hypothetical protein
MIVDMKNFLISGAFLMNIYIIFYTRQANYHYIHPVKDVCTRYECNVHFMWK